jgi:glutamate--cysteine ligase
MSFTWGIERETHRIRADGTPSRERHPASLPLPSFTMDFAESMLELVTRPQPSIAEVLDELDVLTRTASRNIGSDLLWPFSMPPALPPDGEIRLAHPGTGEAGRSAERYRNGLALRYGIARQMICGVHVNVSLRPALLAFLASFAPLSGEEGKERSIGDAYYLRLVRNLVDELDALVFFFGASPAQDETARAALAAPAVSIRNSPLGYARGEYRPFFDLGSIAAHAAGIRRGLRAESATFRRLGLVRDGRAIQLNGKVFQKEKEFYAPIRFRSIPGRGETPLTALERRGVEYVELRFFDVDPFSPTGVSVDALRLLQLLLLDGLTRVSQPRPNAEWKERLANADEAAMRDPFDLTADDRLAKASSLLETLLPFAEALDGEGGEKEYSRSLARYRLQMVDPRLATSARLYAAYKASGTTWTAFGSRIAARNAQGGQGGYE